MERFWILILIDPQLDEELALLLIHVEFLKVRSPPVSLCLLLASDLFNLGHVLRLAP